ncbi:FAD-dependent monooxygenase [Poseidonocella sedimentorum]|uniref:Dehydrogenase (Flavoprotein) n=1 Tax=Poseidonocella sedimentorum TaxID=871652 RepID=A0A1I6ELK0_9RHOB|nr:FAD-dependent monooxygenase [Poseidonocella sedimentorum]SFR18653.1 Dehydrogenase (flavoprotein) [Poseidonocella sedimentorum]
MRRDYDVVIAGSGPAGSATAITLGRAGLRVLIAEKRQVARARAGETLAPAAKRLLTGVIGGQDGAALPSWAEACRGNISCWGDAAPMQQDFDFSAYGKGLCVDRSGLDAALLAEASQLGAEHRTGATLAVQGRQDGRWDLLLRSGDAAETLTAAYIVDATGRSARLGASLGLPRTRSDPLFSFGMLFDSSGADRDDHGGHTRIEACPYGWWYSNVVPSARHARRQRLVVLHADLGSAEATAAARPGGFLALLARTRLMQATLTERGCAPVGKVLGAPAGNASLDHIAMEGFLAVGDAAQAYDPLSSQGLERAMTSGGLAGHALAYALSNPQEPRAYLAHYHQNLRQHWARHLRQHRSYYAMETRWPDHPFWARRRSEQTFPQPDFARDAR